MSRVSEPAAVAAHASGSPGRRLAFTKMEGLGNDYIYMEEFDAPLADASELAVRMSDRHFGVGSDGLVLMGPSHCADFRMRMFNADGSEAEMCGNATRCVAKYLYENGLTDKTSITLETLAGVRTLDLHLAGRKVERVTVNMGAPVLEPDRIPVQAEGERFIDRELTVNGRRYRGTAVSMGNPHLVIPVCGLDTLDLPALGPLFEHHALFPRRVNTEFVEVRGKDHIRMRVWERGAGETLACGTGACAALVACCLNGLTGRRATVALRGGDLDISWDEDGTVRMTGPARIVFTGEYRT